MDQIRQQALELCQEIETLPASEEQTNVSLLANELYNNLNTINVVSVDDISETQLKCASLGIVTKANPIEYIGQLEEFMSAVARLFRCLPSYCNPSPTQDNKHIINKIESLLLSEEKRLGGCR